MQGLVLLYLASESLAQHDSKRGIAYVGNTNAPDNNLLTSTKSPLSWYYNWYFAPPTQVPGQNLQFTPLLHGLAEANSSQVAQTLQNLPKSATHLLTFNEPDGSVSSGGSDISPEAAAKSYIQNIVPLRNGKGGRKWLISQPSTTGTGNGLDWLRRFNDSCYQIDKQNGCPADFISAHWYGGFPGLASWLGQLNEHYNTNISRNPPIKIWITELGLPQADAATTFQMMNETLPYLDNLTYVDRYSWFGAFRSNAANEWTGNGVALFDQNGGLTQLGAYYMGGAANGFTQGQKGDSGGSGGGGGGGGGGNGGGGTGSAAKMLGINATLLWTSIFLVSLLNLRIQI